MAPSGRNTVTCRFLLFLSFAIIGGTSLVLYLFHEELIGTIRSYTHSTCHCTTSQCEAQIAGEGQAAIGTIYKDLPTLEELPASNVLWINNTANNKPEAWGISMFHSFHCLKMWKESLNPETAMKSHVHSDSEYAEHSNHCINYLLQVPFPRITKIGEIANLKQGHIMFRRWYNRASRANCPGWKARQAYTWNGLYTSV